MAFKAKETMFYFHPAVLISHLFLKLHLFGLRSSSGGGAFFEANFSLGSFSVRQREKSKSLGRKVGHFLSNALRHPMLTPRCQRLQQLCQELESESWTVQYTLETKKSHVFKPHGFPGN